MKYKHNSKQQRHFFSGYLHYRLARRTTRTRLRGQPLRHNAIIVVGLGLIGLASFAYTPITSAGSATDQTKPTASEHMEQLPLIGHFAYKPVEFLTNRGSSNGSASGNLPKTAPSIFKHQGISTTIFWVGEASGSDNANIPNHMSVWDANWQVSFGGVDDPAKRNGYFPAGFTPKENPFYFALPYSDISENSKRKPSATNCAGAGAITPYSWCKNTWIAIRKGDRVAYGQWQDAGPLGEDDTSYVFGSASPKNSFNAHAGLDVSPAIRDYLDLEDVDSTDWTFVPASQVPSGPWKSVITTSTGDVRIW